jgi:hypothetical protein
MGGHIRKCSLTPEQLFWSKVDKNGPDGCWNWTDYKDKWGYGDLKFKGRHLQSHRISWMLLMGDPGKLDVLHKCHNTSCCNPDHLYLGTDLENARDRLEAGRYARGERCPRRKISEAQAREILSLKGTGPAWPIAKRFGLHPGAVHAIWRGDAWSHLSTH